jgi:hypothetical protein
MNSADARGFHFRSKDSGRHIWLKGLKCAQAFGMLASTTQMELSQLYKMVQPRARRCINQRGGRRTAIETAQALHALLLPARPGKRLKGKQPWKDPVKCDAAVKIEDGPAKEEASEADANQAEAIGALSIMPFSYLATLQPGSSMPVLLDEGCALAYVVQCGSLSATTSNGLEQDLRPGDFILFSAGEGRPVFTNNSYDQVAYIKLFNILT